MKKNKNRFLSDKIKSLQEEGKTSQQAISIALSMMKDGGYYQMGGQQFLQNPFGQPTQRKQVELNLPSIPSATSNRPSQSDFDMWDSSFNNPTPRPSQQDFNQWDTSFKMPNLEDDLLTLEDEQFNKNNQKLKQQVANNSSWMDYDKNALDNYYEQEQGAFDPEAQTQTYEKPTQFFNPYAGVDLNSAASIFGQSLQQGDTLSGVASGAKLGLGLARNFMGGFSAGKERNRVLGEYSENQRNAMTGAKTPVALKRDGGEFYQEGGQQDQVMQMVMQMLQQGVPPEQIMQELVNAGIPQEEATQVIQMVMQQAQQQPMMQQGGIFMQPEVPLEQSNAEIEDGEYVKDTEGVKYAEGEKHSNGGIPTQLEQGAQVLSDYKKVGKELAKQFSEQLGVKVNPSDTFATVLDKVNKKSGFDQKVEEIEKDFEKLKKQEREVKDDATLALNTEVLQNKMQDSAQELQALDAKQQEVFNMLFQAQEQAKQQEEQTENFMRDGGTIQDLMNQYGVSKEKAMQLIPQYQEGGINDPNSPFYYAGQDGYNIATSINPTAQGYQTKANSIVDNGLNVERTQSFTGQGYGKQMADVEKTIDNHSWYFDTEEKKNAFRNAVKNRGSQQEVLKFQQAYNQEIERRAKEAGLPQEDINKIKATVGFSDSGVQKEDGMFGAFTSTRPLFDFIKNDSGEVELQPLTQEDDNNIVSEADRKRMNMLLLPDQTPMQPWAMQAPAMTTQTIYAPKYNEIDPTQQLMEVERANIATSQNIANLPDNQRAAANLALDANSNDAKNKLMAETERYNQMARERTEGAEAQQKTQQSQANVVAFQNYQQLLGNELEANESDWRNFYNRLQSNQMNNYLTVNEFNRSNAFNPNVQFDGQGYEVINTPTFTNDASKMNLTQEKKKTTKAKKGGTFKCNRFGK